jgi:DNA modification methylase
LTAERPRPGEKRSLTHVGGAVATRGDAEVAAALASALDVASSVEGEEAEDAARAHVHGFHTYAARLHPETARRLVARLSAERATVLDPFCGSGTVLVEARALGRRAVGVDANPLAVRLARLKTTPAGERLREAMITGATRVAEVAEDRRKARAGSSRRYPPDDVAAFAPHTLLELDGLRTGLEAERDPEVRSALYLVLSSILIKVSRRAGDTSERGREPRIAAGYPSRLFVKKTEELTRRLAAIEPALAEGPDARVLEGDARELQGVADASVDLVVTSPPYPGVYDYAVQHALRLRWLGLQAERFDRAEIGARRRARAEPGRAIAEYEDDMASVLAAVARTLRPGGLAVLVVADGAIGDRAVRMDELLGGLARGAGLVREALASQERPHFHDATAPAFRDRARREHAVALARPGR